MYRPKQFCAWLVTSVTEFHPSQTGADHEVVLLSPSCTRFVQTVVCPLETPSTAPRIGPCGEDTLRPPRPRVDDDDDGEIGSLGLCYTIIRIKCVANTNCRRAFADVDNQFSEFTFIITVFSLMGGLLVICVIVLILQHLRVRRLKQLIGQSYSKSSFSNEPVTFIHCGN